jgi:hypothetical protein
MIEGGLCTPPSCSHGENQKFIIGWIGEFGMYRPLLKGVFTLVIFILFSTGSSSCAGTATPAKVSQQGTLTSITPTVQALELTPSETPESSAIQPTTSPTTNLPAVEIINDLCYGYPTEGGSIFQIAGEVRNNTTSPMGAWVFATIYDVNHQVVGTVDYSPTELNVIPPGGKSAFEMEDDSNNWPGAATCEEQATGIPYDFPIQPLQILSQESSLDGAGLHIHGIVQNMGAAPAVNVRIFVTLYDVNGKVIAVDSTPSTQNTITAGGTSTFEFYPLRWNRYDHYGLQVEGQVAGNP